MGYKVAIIHSGSDVDALVEALGRSGHQGIPLPLDEHLAQGLRSAHVDAALICSDAQLARDGSVPALLELAGIPFVGSASHVARRLSDRSEAARRLRDYDVFSELEVHAPVAVTLGPGAWEALGLVGCADMVASAIPAGYPLCVRPAHERGHLRVTTQEQLAQAIEQTLAQDSLVVVQEWVEGVELLVPVASDLDGAVTLPAVELTVDGCGNAELVTPVRLESLSPDASDAQALRSQIERDALDAFIASGCRDLGLVHLVWDGARSQLLDVDACPSWEAHGPLRRSLACAGIDLDAFLDDLITIAVER